MRCGFFSDQLIAKIYPHQLECESTVNTPAPTLRTESPSISSRKDRSDSASRVPRPLPKLEGHFHIWPKPVDAAKQCKFWEMSSADIFRHHIQIPCN